MFCHIQVHAYGKKRAKIQIFITTHLKKRYFAVYGNLNLWKINYRLIYDFLGEILNDFCGKISSNYIYTFAKNPRHFSVYCI